MATQVWWRKASCAHSPVVMALLTDLRGQLARCIPEVGDVLGWELSPECR